MRRGGYLSLGLNDIFDPKGRIDRMTYLMYGVMLWVMQFLLIAGVVAILFVVAPSIPDAWRPYLPLARAIVTVPILYGIFCIQAKRLHDMGLPAILGLIALTNVLFPIGLEIARPLTTLPSIITSNIKEIDEGIAWIVLIFHALMLFLPGKSGANRYGLSSAGEDRPRPHMLEG